jgi:hypothetical protein
VSERLCKIVPTCMRVSECRRVCTPAYVCKLCANTCVYANTRVCTNTCVSACVCAHLCIYKRVNPHATPMYTVCVYALFTYTHSRSRARRLRSLVGSTTDPCILFGSACAQGEGTATPIRTDTSVTGARSSRRCPIR